MASNNDYDPALEPGTPWHHHPLAIKVAVGIPAILFGFASLVVLAQALKHRTWCAWALVLAGLYLAFGTYNLNMGYTFDHLMGLAPSLADDKSAMRMMGFIEYCNTNLSPFAQSLTDTALAASLSCKPPL